LVKLFKECGGKIYFNTEIKEILTDNKTAKGICFADKSVEYFDAVVCNSDVTYTYKNLIDPNKVPALLNLRLSQMEYSNSLVVIYFGTNKKYNDSQLTHHNLILGNEYKHLMKDIFKRKVLPEDLGLYVHMPTRTDNTIAPEGCESFYALSLVPNLDGKIDWDNIMPEYTDKVLGFLEEKYLPRLKSHIIAQHAINPLHFKHTLNSYKGAAFSIKPSMMQSGYFRPQVKSKYFENLYFTGAGVHPGAGVPAVMASGKIAAEEIMAKTASAKTVYTKTKKIIAIAR
jgi:phytoene desaturase